MNEHEIEPESEEGSGQVPIISYWWPNITLSLVADNSPLPLNSHPALMQCKYLFKKKGYLPLFLF